MAWTYLLIAAALEVVWALALKYSEGFTRPGPSALAIVGMILSIVFLALAVKTLPIGTAYAMWTGIGAALTAVGGIILFNEPKDAIRIAFILLILIGVIGLKCTTREEGPQDPNATSELHPMSE